jgi:hypothetical protein
MKIKWIFKAYKSEDDYGAGLHYFEKAFTDHEKLKEFSGKHSKREKVKYPEYCSDYERIDGKNNGKTT